MMTDVNWTILYVVRHGQTQWNADGRWQGWLDSDLTETGREQAAEAADRLRNVGAVALYCSDSGRARDTARIIGDVIGLQAVADQGLRERYYGEYEGLTSDEIDYKFPNMRYEAGRDRRDTWRPIGGESLVEVSARVMATVRMIAEAHSGQAAVIVTHGGVLRVLDSVSCGESLDDIWDRAPGNCCIFELKANPQGDLKIVRHFAEFIE